MNFNIVKSEIIFSGKVFDIQVDEIKYNSGNTAPREVVLHNGGSVIVAETGEGKLILLKQFRYPFKEIIWELPAGKLDRGEDPMDCAVRELKEETGLISGKTIKLGQIYTSPGFSNEVLHIYKCSNLTKGESDLEEGEESIQVFEFSIEQIIEMISNGEIVDAKTISGIFFYQNNKFKN